MSFDWHQKLTLNGLERRNSRNLCVISRNSAAFGTDYVKVIKIYRYFLRQKCTPKNYGTIGRDHP